MVIYTSGKQGFPTQIILTEATTRSVYEPATSLNTHC